MVIRHRGPLKQLSQFKVKMCGCELEFIVKTRNKKQKFNICQCQGETTLELS